MDKLKDIIYDYTDLLLSLLVILIIVFIIGTNFSFFDQDLSSFIASSDNENNTNQQSPVREDQKDLNEQAPTNENVEEESEVDGAPEAEEEMDAITIEIPQGATAAQIGDTLYTHDLVNSSSEFVETTENLNVSHRLRPGTFDIPRDATIREMIQILIQSSL